MEKFNKLKEYISDLRNAAVAYSAGVDSTLLLVITKEILGNNVSAVFVNGPNVSNREAYEARNFAYENKIKLIEIEFNPFDVPEFVKNSFQRCYFCKKEMFKLIKDKTDKKNILDGTNKDDEKDYRPGIKALLELGIISPFRMFDITKDDIRKYSEKLGLKTYNKPSFACLASRVPYNSEITKDKLSMTDMAEEFLYKKGFSQFRVRNYDNLAKIEVLEEEFLKLVQIKNEVSCKFKEIGFTFVSIDIDGYKSGNMNVRIK